MAASTMFQAHQSHPKRLAVRGEDACVDKDGGGRGATDQRGGDGGMTVDVWSRGAKMNEGHSPLVPNVCTAMYDVA